VCGGRNVSGRRDVAALTNSKPITDTEGIYFKTNLYCSTRKSG
jgi:hypothetical protein